MTAAEYQRAYDLGQQARRAGKPETASPWGKSPTLRELHAAWVRGWQDAKSGGRK